MEVFSAMSGVLRGQVRYINGSTVTVATYSDSANILISQPVTISNVDQFTTDLSRRSGQLTTNGGMKTGVALSTFAEVKYQGSGIVHITHGKPNHTENVPSALQKLQAHRIWVENVAVGENINDSTRRSWKSKLISGLWKPTLNWCKRQQARFSDSQSARCLEWAKHDVPVPLLKFPSKYRCPALRSNVHPPNFVPDAACYDDLSVRSRFVTNCEFHKTAVACYRSGSVFINYAYNGKQESQLQCCYDSHGVLIRTQPDGGTADKAAGKLDHETHDVDPFNWCRNATPDLLPLYFHHRPLDGAWGTEEMAFI